MLRRYSFQQDSHRPGQILVTLALVLVVLLGMVGLIIDTGLLMAAHRRAQSAADAAALAAAMELFEGYSQSVANQAALAYVQPNNNLPNATVTVNFGSGLSALAAPEHRTAGYVEVFVTLPATTYFIQALGINPNQSVEARAVAGFEPSNISEGAIILDPCGANTGLDVSGGGLLKVSGNILVNNLGKGLQVMNAVGNTQWPNPYGYNQYAVATGNNGCIYCQNMQVLGGVDVLGNIYNINDYPNTPALGAGTPPYPVQSGLGAAYYRPDPFAQMPIPVPSSLTNYGAVKVNAGQTVSLNPGIYQDINIVAGGKATFASGIYVLSPSKPNQGLTINGDSTATGNQVLFYVTGSDYMSGGVPGQYDIADGAVDFTPGSCSQPPWPSGENSNVSQQFASVTINGSGSNINLTGMDIPGQGSTAYKNVLFFQRRRNGNDFNVSGSAGLNGMVYAKWGRAVLTGSGNYNGAFVVGRLKLAGQATITVGGQESAPLINRVYLVE